MSQITKHTSYILINAKGDIQMIHYAPDQDYSGQKASDSYALAQGLFIKNISHDLWLGEVECKKVIGSPSGLFTIDNLRYTIVAKRTYGWDMSLPLGKRKLNEKKSKNWNIYFKKCKDNQTTISLSAN